MRVLMGEIIERALRAIGITEERVKRYVWECGCKDRKRRFNEIDLWARTTLKAAGSVILGSATLGDVIADARRRLNEILAHDPRTKE